MSLKIINNYACAEYYLHGPLFAGSYLQVTWWDLGQWKKKNLLRMIILSICLS